MTVARSSAFLRSYKKMIKGRPDLEQLFRERLGLFMADPFNPKLATHKLKGQLRHNWAFSLNSSLRVVFAFAGKDVVVLENIGPHDNVY